MKQGFAKRVSFAGKSLLWSLLLYAITTVILDWNTIVTVLQQKENNSAIVKRHTNETLNPVKITILIPMRHDTLRKMNLAHWYHMFVATGAVLSRIVK